MAKSIRCKRRRRMRNVKREKYAKKNLEQLKKILASDNVKQIDSEIKELCTVKTASDIRKEKKAEAGPAKEMEEDKVIKQFNAKTLRDEHGTYPIWMNNRSIRKHAKQAAKKKKKKGDNWFKK